MATHIATGFSADGDQAAAFHAAAIQARTRLNQSFVDLVIVFCTRYYARSTHLASVRKVLQPKGIIGAVTTGLILSQSIESRGVAVLAMTSDEISFQTGLHDRLGPFNQPDTGLKFAKNIANKFSGPTRQAFLFFLNGLKKNNSFMIRGLQEGLGRAFPIAGAIPCSSPEPRESLQIHEETIYNDAAVGLLLGGPFTFAIASRNGLHPLGKPRLITAAEDNLVHLIDNKPAVGIYQDYFGEGLSGLPEGRLDKIATLYPLGFRSETPGKYTIHSPVETLSDGTLVFQKEIDAGTHCHLMITDKNLCRTAAHDAAMEIRGKLEGRAPKLVLIFESLNRQKFLGRSAWQEIMVIKEILGLTTPVFGMYTYGEFAPIETQQRALDLQIQNANIVIMAIG